MVPPLRGNQFRIFLADGGVVGDSRGGHDQGLQAGGVRFDLAQFFWTDHAQAGQAVGFSALAQFFETREFVGFGRDDYFAADFVRDVVLAAELDHGGGAGDAESRLQRTGLVVEAGVDDAAVVSALVAGDAVFFLQNQKPQMGKAARDFERDGEADHTAADDDYVVTGIDHSVGRI